MRTRMFRAGIRTIWFVVPLWPLLLSSCSHTAGHSQAGIGPDHCAACVAGSATVAPMPAPAPAPIPAPVVPSYGGQITCPVSGAALGSAGLAVPVTVKGQTIYVCCQGCVAKVQADPDTYLARVAAERAGRQAPSAEHARGPATAGPYGGQKTCPVTGEELAPDGSAVAVTVKGQTIYVCCPGCAAKVKRDPDTYLARVAAERDRQVGVRP